MLAGKDRCGKVTVLTSFLLCLLFLVLPSRPPLFLSLSLLDVFSLRSNVGRPGQHNLSQRRERMQYSPTPTQSRQWSDSETMTTAESLSGLITCFRKLFHFAVSPTPVVNSIFVGSPTYCLLDSRLPNPNAMSGN